MIPSETWPQIKRRHAAEKWELVYNTWLECKSQAKTAEILDMQRSQVTRMFMEWHDPKPATSQSERPKTP